MDAFASESNTRTPRFFHKPNSEAIDALVVPDWARSSCPSCGAVHREVVFAFPPSSLVRATVEKGRADCALCVLLVPMVILAQHWGQLLAASVLQRTAQYVDCFLRIRDPALVLARPDPRGAAEMAVFACDFSRLQHRAGLPPLSSCPRAAARRTRPLCCSPGDALDSHCLREARLARRDSAVHAMEED